MSVNERIRALIPDLVNGKTPQQLEEELVAGDEQMGCHVVDGTKFPYSVQPSNLEALKTFEVRQDDVFIFTYPRSGTHWVGEIVQYVLHDGKGDFDRSFMTNGLEITLADDPSQVESVTPGYKAYAAMASPRCILSHCVERFRPPQISTKQAKMIYVARNPKDVLVSWFNMFKIGPSHWTFSEVLWAFCLERMYYGSWFDHVLGYWNQRNDENLLFLKYEDFHKDLRGTIGRIAKHLGKDLNDDVMDDILEHVTFGGMQKTYQQLEEEHGEEGRVMTRRRGIRHLRKGQVGDWKNAFTVSQSALFDKVYELKMEGTGLDFDFEI